MSKLVSVALVATAVSALGASHALAQARPSRAQNQQNAAIAEIPKCAQKLGTLAIANGDNDGWRAFNLDAPEKLLRLIVQRSGCFDLVDRGTGLAAAQQERELAGGIGLQRGSNVGVGQVKAADYVLVAEVAGQNANAGGSALAGVAGGLIGGRVGGLVGGIRTQKLEANTILSLTSVRTTETLAVEEGHYAKTDIGWGAGGGLYSGGFGGVVGGGYENTDIGKVVTIAFVDAYSKLVRNISASLSPGAGQQAEQRAMKVAQAATLRREPNTTSGVVRALPVGIVLYPTGNRQDLWWEVIDDNDNVGWVQNDRLVAAQTAAQ